MLREPVSIIILSLLVVSALALASNVQPVRAGGTINIGAGGSIDSPTAPTSRGGEVTAQDQPDWWPMFHHDLTHTGYSTSSAPNTNQTLWNYTTSSIVVSSPAVAGGVVYVGSFDYNVYALNATTGTLVWNYTTGGAVASSPAVAGGVVYVGSYDYKVYGLNATTGAKLWSYTTGSLVEAPPAVAGGVVYVGSDDHNVYALNAATGALIWSFTTGSYVDSSPAVAGGMVYIDSEDHRVYAFGGACVSTPTGTNVTVTFPAQNVSVTFDSVTSAGFTTLYTANAPNSLFPSVACVGITTTATYNGNITLKFPYDPDGLSLQDQQATKIWLWDDSSSCWVDLTTYVNTTSHVVYGLSPHLSMFGVTSNLGITGDLAVQGTTTVSIPSAPPALPHSLVALNYYQINTTKSLSPPINLSLAYNNGNIPLGEEILTQVWMWNETSTSWVDITTGVNAADHMVYGSALHLSMFGVTSLPPPPSGIAVASANCPKTVVCEGYGANINVTISNQGIVPQTNFNVTLFCNTTLLATFHVNQLDASGQITLNVTWNTAGWAKGNYSISTCYIDSMGSTYYIASIGWIRVSMVGDLTGGTSNPWNFVPDGKVDGKDIAIVASCFGSAPGCPAPYVWNANCDVNNDAKVDGKDIALVAAHYGQAGP